MSRSSFTYAAFRSLFVTWKQKRHGSHFSMNSRAYVMPIYPVIGYGIAVKYVVFRNLYRFSADRDTYSLMVFIVGTI